MRIWRVLDAHRNQLADWQVSLGKLPLSFEGVSGHVRLFADDYDFVTTEYISNVQDQLDSAGLTNWNDETIRFLERTIHPVRTIQSLMDIRVPASLPKPLWSSILDKVITPLTQGILSFSECDGDEYTSITSALITATFLVPICILAHDDRDPQRETRIEMFQNADFEGLLKVAKENAETSRRKNLAGLPPPGSQNDSKAPEIDSPYSSIDPGLPPSEKNRLSKKHFEMKESMQAFEFSRALSIGERTENAPSDAATRRS